MKKLAAMILLGSLLVVAGGQEARADSPGSHLMLLTGENVQRTLNLTPAQKKSIERLVAEYRKEVAPFHEKRDARALAMIEASTRAFDNRARGILTDEQESKLYVVEARVLGPWVLHSSSVQQQLVLSESQVNRINRVAEKAKAYNNRLHREVEAGKITNAQRIEKMKEFRLRESRGLEKILTPAQRQQLAKLAQ